MSRTSTCFDRCTPNGGEGTSVVLCRYSGRGKGSGIEVDTEAAHLWTMRNGRAVRLEIFSSRERALEAAGVGK